MSCADPIVFNRKRSNLIGNPSFDDLSIIYLEEMESEPYQLFLLDKMCRDLYIKTTFCIINLDKLCLAWRLGFTKVHKII